MQTSAQSRGNAWDTASTQGPLFPVLGVGEPPRFLWGQGGQGGQVRSVFEMGPYLQEPGQVGRSKGRGWARWSARGGSRMQGCLPCGRREVGTQGEGEVRVGDVGATTQHSPGARGSCHCY